MRSHKSRFFFEEHVHALPLINCKLGLNAMVKRCRTLICHERIPHEKSGVIPMITVSLGVGTIISSDTDDPLKFIEEVDKRLYQAKQRGRNCIANGD